MAPLLEAAHCPFNDTSDEEHWSCMVAPLCVCTLVNSSHFTTTVLPQLAAGALSAILGVSGPAVSTHQLEASHSHSLTHNECLRPRPGPWQCVGHISSHDWRVGVSGLVAGYYVLYRAPVGPLEQHSNLLLQVKVCLLLSCLFVGWG